VRLLGFNRVRGTFTAWRASVYYDPDALERSSVSFVADAASISTSIAERDDDLKRASFFDVAHFPKIRFRSTRVEQAANGFFVTGDLTIRDSTHQIRLPVQVLAPLSTDPFTNQRVSFGTVVTLNRRDFGVVGPPFWNGAISDSLVVEIEIGCRVWNYSQLDWSAGPRHRSVGELLFSAADSGRLATGLAQARSLWARRQSDTTWDFSAWEFEIAAMRLAQRHELRAALAILELGEELEQGSRPRALAALLARRGEVRLLLERRPEATADFRQATFLDPDNTDAVEWLRHSENEPERH
jgi:polyisoprenoid-binding protein YceI